MRKKLRSLALFMEKMPAATHGVILYNGEYEYHEELNIHCVPAWSIS